MAKKKDNSLFDAINSINDKQKRDINHKNVTGFILTLWMAENKELIEYANKINPYIFNLPDKIVYKYFYNAVPEKKRFVKWTAKEKLSKENDNKINELCVKYNISPREAKLSIDK